MQNFTWNKLLLQCGISNFTSAKDLSTSSIVDQKMYNKETLPDIAGLLSSFNRRSLHSLITSSCAGSLHPPASITAQRQRRRHTERARLRLRTYEGFISRISGLCSVISPSVVGSLWMWSERRQQSVGVAPPSLRSSPARSAPHPSAPQNGGHRRAGTRLRWGPFCCMSSTLIT